MTLQNLKDSVTDEQAEALLYTLTSANETDRNGEEANVVDGLFEIARAIHALARAIAGEKP